MPATPLFASAADQQPLSGRAYDPEPSRERIRATVALAFSLIFALVIGFYAWGAYHIGNEPQWTRFKSALDVILPAVSTALGSVLGFYFGAQKR